MPPLPLVDRFLNEADYDQIAEHGISPDEVLRQIQILLDGTRNTQLIRPATIDDGITRVSPDQQALYTSIFVSAAPYRSVTTFVPASGDATRLFKDFYMFYVSPESSYPALSMAAGFSAERIELFFRNLDTFAISLYLQKSTTLELDRKALIRIILDKFGSLPKALVPFHKYSNHARTPLEEHVIDAQNIYSKKILFTVAPTRSELFDRQHVSIKEFIEPKSDLAVDFAVQNPSTDAIALTEARKLLRDDQGNIRFRPGGHGSVFQHLSLQDNDIVFLRNIDNVVTDPFKPEGVDVRCCLGGILIDLESKVHSALWQLATGTGVTQALAILGSMFGNDVAAIERCASQEAIREHCINELNRPLRVCGVVRDQSQKGSGPFWVRQPDGSARLQIVEEAEISASNEEQLQIYRSSCYFNAVEIVCSVRDFRGFPHDLRRFRDEEAILLTEKVVNGVRVRGFEYPGLWNGSMSGWNTVFVEISPGVFNPVKYLTDLLAPRHLPYIASPVDAGRAGRCGRAG